MVSGKAELPERRDAFTVDVEYAAAASESVVRGMAMPESLSHITTESQWRSLVLKSGGKYWHVYMSKKTAGGRNTARYLGRYLKKPPIAASRLAHYNGGASLSFRYGPQNGRNGDGNADTA